MMERIITKLEIVRVTTGSIRTVNDIMKQFPQEVIKALGDYGYPIRITINADYSVVVDAVNRQETI